MEEEDVDMLREERRRGLAILKDIRRKAFFSISLVPIEAKSQRWSNVGTGWEDSGGDGRYAKGKEGEKGGRDRSIEKRKRDSGGTRIRRLDRPEPLCSTLITRLTGETLGRTVAGCY